MADEKETGLKWWIRHVIVPLIGGGGIIAILISVREHPSIPVQPTPQVSVRVSETPTPVPSPSPAATKTNELNPASKRRDEAKGIRKGAWMASIYFETPYGGTIGPLTIPYSEANKGVRISWRVMGARGRLYLLKRVDGTVMVERNITSSGVRNESLSGRNNEFVIAEAESGSNEKTELVGIHAIVLQK